MSYKYCFIVPSRLKYCESTRLSNLPGPHSGYVLEPELGAVGVLLEPMLPGKGGWSGRGLDAHGAEVGWQFMLDENMRGPFLEAPRNKEWVL